jgi:hypothetical protein
MIQCLLGDKNGNGDEKKRNCGKENGVSMEDYKKNFKIGKTCKGKEKMCADRGLKATRGKH